MERLTQNNFDYCLEMCEPETQLDCAFYMSQAECVCGEAAIYNKLREYENAEQEDRLVVLPCKVGDTVYVFYTGRRNCKWPCNMKKGQIYEVTVSGMRLHDWSDDWSALLFFDTKEMTGDYEFSFDEFGKTIFQTRAEAEAAMKGVSEDA